MDRLARLARDERAPLAALARAEGVLPEDAVDCVQEGLSTLLEMSRRAALPHDAGEWGRVLAGVVRNIARNRRRRHFVARTHHEIDDTEIVDGMESQGADDLLALAEDRLRLRACVDELCEIQKAVVTLRMLEERAGEDVATALGISPGHVAVLLHRAKRALRACMTPE
jgi:RNA polymerase sigma-70 factor (ECF subfamily)